MSSKNNITILDGGMGRELQKMGAPFKQPEWSALALMEAPEMVLKAHMNFIEAGAQVITTNSYALIPHHIGEERFKKRGAELIELSARLARQAADESGDSIKVAGCIPPLFGSYQPELFKPDSAADILKPFIEQQSKYVDFWLVETVSSLTEAYFMMDMLKNRKKDIWIAFTLTDYQTDGFSTTLRSGDNLEVALKAFRKMPYDPKALLFNCSQPEEMNNAIKIATSLFPEIPIGAYANSFLREKKTLTGNGELTTIREDLSPNDYLEYAQIWADSGARIIGGCCGIGPEYIQELNTLKKNNLT